MSDVITRAGTLLDALETAFARAATYNERSRVAPSAILWPDAREEWTRLLPRLREAFPQLLTLGDHSPDEKTGPAIWIKCMIARTLPGGDWPEEAVPVVYLPGVSRRDIRAVERSPQALQPLAELQYRGVLWTQTNGRDWTVRAFLMSEDGGLGLDVAGDQSTQEALQRALTELADTPIDTLQGQHLDADVFRSLIADDPVRDLLHWLSRPDEIKSTWRSERWATFCEICTDTYGFDPEKDGPIPAAKRLGMKEGPWTTVWQRYIEAPDRYPGIPEKLRQARPPTTGDLFAREPSWPQDNEALEESLRAAFLKLDGVRQDQAAERVRELDEEHQERRSWVWAQLGRSPLAEALRYLSTLAEAVGSPVGGSTPDAVAKSYRTGGWKADNAALQALQSVDTHHDIEAVHAAVNALYRPWLERGAEAFQEAVQQHGAPTPPDAPDPASGEVLLFADALRYDIGQRLLERLRFENLQVESDWHWSAHPSLTPTAKPAVAPIASALNPQSPPDQFAPELDGKRLDIRRFRDWMEEEGHQILQGGETGDPSGTAWTEIGTLDKHGHNEGWKLARRIDELLRDVTGRVQQLLDAGWSAVRIVTDHGWLVLPGSLPKENLPRYLAETRWGRCATLKKQVQTNHLTIGWHWNPDVRIAMAPGIHVHRNALEYAHGGLSVQECVVPQLVVRPEAGARPSATIDALEWIRLRCRVHVKNPTIGLRVDMRTRVEDASTSIAMKPKQIKEDGTTSLAIPDPQQEGQAATVVLLDGDDVIHTYSTTVGRNE